MTVKELAERLNKLCQDGHGENASIIVVLEGSNDIVASREVSFNYGMWTGRPSLIIRAKSSAVIS